jgi:Neuraminidase (sialidase)
LLRFSPYFLNLKSADVGVQVPYSDLDGLEVERRFIRSRINFKLAKGSQEVFGWVKNGAQEKIAQVLKARSAKAMNFEDRNATNTEWIEGCTDWYLSATRGERWVTYREIDDILQEHEDRLTYLWNTDVSDLPMFELELANHIRYMNEVKAVRTGFRSECNLEC